MSQQNLNKVYGQIAIVEDITGDVTLDKYDTGKIFYIDSPAGGCVISLPSASSDLTGWTAKFIVKTAPTGSDEIRIGGTVLTGSDVGGAWTITSNQVKGAGSGGTTTVTGDTCEIVCVDGATATFVASCASQN